MIQDVRRRMRTDAPRRGAPRRRRRYEAFSAIDPAQTSGCALFPANATGTAISYLVIPQATSGVPDDSSAFAQISETIRGKRERGQSVPKVGARNVPGAGEVWNDELPWSIPAEGPSPSDR